MLTIFYLSDILYSNRTKRGDLFMLKKEEKENLFQYVKKLKQLDESSLIITLAIINALSAKGELDKIEQVG